MLFALSPVYATEIFNNGFESGDFTAWTGTGGSIDVVATPTHHGSYSARANADGEICYKTFTNSVGIYVRCYVRFSALTITSSQYSGFFGVTDGSSGTYIRAYHDGANVVFQLRDEWGNSRTTDAVISLDTWYCVEVFFDVAGSGKAFKLWIDGVLKINVTDSKASGAGTYIWAGVQYSFTGDQRYIDCVVVSDAYIGPEATSIAYGFSLSETAATTENLTTQKNLIKTLSEVAAFVSSLNLQKNLWKILPESATATSALSSQFSLKLSFVELAGVVSIADSLSALLPDVPLTLDDILAIAVLALIFAVALPIVFMVNRRRQDGG